MAARESSPFPATGSAPRSWPPRASCSTALGDFELEEHLVGGASIDAHGTALTDEVLEACRGADAVLLAAVGGPKWDAAVAADPRPRGPSRACSACARASACSPTCARCGPSPALLDASPLKRDRIEGTDLLVVRELTGGIYFGDSGRDGRHAPTTTAPTASARSSGSRAWPSQSARTKVTSVDKANVLETSRLWRETVTRVGARGVPRRRRSTTCWWTTPRCSWCRGPADFDVIVTENLFGDILSDEAAMLTGSLGMLPSASLGEPARPGLFEPVHGSAPDIAGTGSGQPAGHVRLGGAHAAPRTRLWRTRPLAVESAIDRALEEGLRTADLGGEATTEDATRAVLANL